MNFQYTKMKFSNFAHPMLCSAQFTQYTKLDFCVPSFRHIVIYMILSGICLATFNTEKFQVVHFYNFDNMLEPKSVSIKSEGNWPEWTLIQKNLNANKFCV